MMTNTTLTEHKSDHGHPMPMTLVQMKNSLLDIPDWIIEDHGRVLKRTFRGNSFTGALILANKIGVLCDQEGCYPEISIGLNFCKITFQSNETGGLQENDFIMAFKINQLLGKLRKAHQNYSLDQFSLIS
jgi:4a-hydroxytetrahydrobiopterin dehydratase